MTVPPSTQHRTYRPIAHLLVAAGAVIALLCVVLPFRADAAGPDSDGDGVTNEFDIDDDADGIIDVEETAADFAWATYDSIEGKVAEGTIGAIGFTYDVSVDIATTDGVFNHGLFPASYEVPNQNPTIRNDVVSTNTITFDQPALNPLIAFASIGNGGTAVPIQFDRPVEVLWSDAVTVDSPTMITGMEGFAIIQIPGEHTSFSFDYLADEFYVNFAFGADPRQPNDADGDSIGDHLDIDSDDDGITDNVEAQPTSGYLEPSGTDVDGNGLDDAFEATPGAGGGLDPVDTDEDGTRDVLDLNSDDDGVADVAERGDSGPTSASSSADGDGDGLLDIFEGTSTSDPYSAADHNRTATTIGLAADVLLAANGANAVPLSVDLLFRDSIAATDADGDGIPNVIEIGPDRDHPIDTDGTGGADHLDTDADGDGRADSTERGFSTAGVNFFVDTDNDGIPNGMDVDVTAGPDVNLNGLDDAFEPVDTDGDGTADYVDLDSDDDGAPDSTDPNPLVPTAVDDTGSTVQLVPVPVDVLANDDFAPGADTTITDLGTGTAAGSIVATPTTGTITYTPTFDELGDVTVDYRACNTAVDPAVCDDATLTITIGLAPTYAITGRVYADLDRDGVLDAGEDDISGVDVWLSRSGPDGHFGTADDVRVATATTASPYTFDGLLAGTYEVRVDATTLPRGMDLTNDIDGGSDQRAVVVVGTDEPTSLDFGQNYLALSGTLRDASGQPIARVPMVITDAAGRVFHVTTADDGSFFLEGSADAPLAAGPATVTATLADGTTVTQTVEVVAGTTPAVAELTVAAAAADGPSTPAQPGADPAVDAGSLAATGLSSWIALRAALGLVSVGGFVVMSARRGRAKVARPPVA